MSPMSPRLLRPRATGFTPKNISGLALWVDFSDATSVTLDSSGKIQSVQDKSGNGYHATQATAADRLSLSTLNGRRCADNGTASNVYRVTYTHGSTSLNLRDTFLVAHWTAGGTTFPGNHAAISGATATGTNSGAMLVSSTGTANWGGASVMAGTGRRWQTNAGPIRTGSASTDFEAFPYITSPFMFHGDANADVTLDGWQIGSDRTLSSRGWRGLICEVVSYTRTITDSERQRLEGYLAWKWGLQATLPYDHPYAASFPGYGTQATPTDADALAYLSAVRTADGGTGVEVGVANAVDSFVKGCKSDGTWSAIKASCILAGARTLSGALVPLAGTAPTNNNFVAADYNRKTGLAGNGTTKFLNSNRANNADPQDSKHLAIYISTFSTIGGSKYASSGGANPTAIDVSAPPDLNALGRVNCGTNAVVSSPTVGFCGVNRSSASLQTLRSRGVNGTTTTASGTPTADTIGLFARFAGDTFTSDGRLAFYSIGEAVDLTKLDTRLTRLINEAQYNLNTGLSGSSYATETLAYINAGYAAGGTLA